MKNKILNIPTPSFINNQINKNASNSPTMLNHPFYQN